MSSTKNIFISREITNESFRQFIKDKDAVLYAKSLVEITPINIKEIPESDWLFFYSKNGIKNFFDQTIVKSTPAILKKKIGVMGKGSNTVLNQYIARDADFIATSDIKDSLKNFWELVQKETVLFVKASKSLSTFEITDRAEQCRSIEVYSNFTAGIKNLPQCDIAAFTSPINARGFALSQNLMKVKSIIAIGETTKDALMELAPGKEILTVKESTEKAILLYIRFLLKLRFKL